MSEGSIIIDTQFRVPQYSPVCAFCRHVDRSGVRRCTAFDGEIPLEIWTGENTHRAPFPGDRGITFEWAPDVTPQARARAERKLGELRPGQ